MRLRIVFRVLCVNGLWSLVRMLRLRVLGMVLLTLLGLCGGVLVFLSGGRVSLMVRMVILIRRGRVRRRLSISFVGVTLIVFMFRFVIILLVRLMLSRCAIRRLLTLCVPGLMILMVTSCWLSLCLLTRISMRVVLALLLVIRCVVIRMRIWLMLRLLSVRVGRMMCRRLLVMRVTCLKRLRRVRRLVRLLMILVLLCVMFPLNRLCSVCWLMVWILGLGLVSRLRFLILCLIVVSVCLMFSLLSLFMLMVSRLRSCRCRLFLM